MCTENAATPKTFSVAPSPSASVRPCWCQRATDLVSMTMEQLPPCPRTLRKWTPAAHMCCVWLLSYRTGFLRCVHVAVDQQLMEFIAE